MTVVLHAPSIHTGGGAVLLLSLLGAANNPVSIALLDERLALGEMRTPYLDIMRVRRSFYSRLLAELSLWRTVKRGDTVICFHGLPPLLPVRGQVIVFLQNRLLLEDRKLPGFPIWLRLRLSFERLWLKSIRFSNIRYIVQTPSMYTAARKTLGYAGELLVAPFTPSVSGGVRANPVATHEFDFIYVASGDPHKNHNALLQAWCYLAELGHKPSLALTIEPSIYKDLIAELDRLNKSHCLKVYNLGTLSSRELSDAYGLSRALIYPSLVESFGLPLIEATNVGLPIIASELDYVRDLVMPVETFDPRSPVSIARAVMRFLGKEMPVVDVLTAEKFWGEIHNLK